MFYIFKSTTNRVQDEKQLGDERNESVDSQPQLESLLPLKRLRIPSSADVGGSRRCGLYPVNGECDDVEHYGDEAEDGARNARHFTVSPKLKHRSQCLQK